MYTIKIQVDSPPGSEQGIKEVVAMYLERFGNARVISIEEDIPQQIGLGPQFQPGTTRAKKNPELRR